MRRSVFAFVFPMLAFAVGACGDDPQATSDTSADAAATDVSPDATTATTAGDTVAADTFAPDTQAGDTIEADTIDVVVASCTAAGEPCAAGASTTALVCVDDTCRTRCTPTADPDGCGSVTRTEIYSGFLAGTYGVEAEDDSAHVLASLAAQSLTADHAYTFALSRDATDSATQLTGRVEDFAGLAAGSGRVVVAHFAPTVSGSIKVTYGQQSPALSPGAVHRFVADLPTVDHALAATLTTPGAQTGRFALPGSSAALRSFVLGSQPGFIVDSGWADLDPATQMAVRVYNSPYLDMHVFVQCSAAAQCEAEVGITAFDLGVAGPAHPDSLDHWVIVPKAATLAVTSKVDQDVHDDVTLTLGAGTHHTLIYLQRADGATVWQDFATTPPAGGEPVVDCFQAIAPFGVVVGYESRVPDVVAPATFGPAHDLTAGQRYVWLYSGTSDLADLTVKPIAFAAPFVQSGKLSLVSLMQSTVDPSTLDAPSATTGASASGPAFLFVCADPAAPTCHFFAVDESSAETCTAVTGGNACIP